jgi:hypothetical protein
MEAHMPKQMQTPQGGLFETQLSASLPSPVQASAAKLLQELLIEAALAAVVVVDTSSKEACDDQDHA